MVLKLMAKACKLVCFIKWLSLYEYQNKSKKIINLSSHSKHDITYTKKT